MVVMKSLAFTPDVIRARRGDRIVWTNEDNVPHNVTWIAGRRFVSSARAMNPGTRFSTRIIQSGSVEYLCSIHPWMRGTIVVSP
jgi:plastocyanin